MIKIDKRVPLPDHRKNGTTYRYPWRDMAVGDSFEIPIEKRSSVASSYPRLKPKRFVSRKVSANTVRVWRVK